ncbi:hypothetical protein B0A52_03150 [Exophiala mesophila]|uniref:Uncharacterized protein n=1 Tax=Exophiala mesophila TaxID=212818 RepID=A0A438NAY7_EXOME|nr:hypothetical protein B0A52_03150 [Exophiala mesophila]
MDMYYSMPATTYLPPAGHWEDTADWPKSYYYIPNQSPAPQGIHPPGPIYSAGPTTTSAQPAMYYYPGGQGFAAGYYANGMYYGNQAPSAPASSWPFTGLAGNPLTPGTLWSPASASAQVAAAIAANTALAQQPNAPSYFVGGTPTEIATQAAIIQANLAALSAAQQPTTHAPFKPGNGSQVWVKEVDGSWTLKDLTDAIDLGPGHWEQHAVSKYWYFIKHVA